MDEAGLTVKVARGEAAFIALRPMWDRLHAAAEPRPIPLSHAWLLASWQTKWRSVWRRLVAIMVLENGEPVMGGAFVVARKGIRPLVFMLDGTIPQRRDLLYRPSSNSVARANLVLETLRNVVVWPRVLNIDACPELSPLIAAGRASGRFGEGEPLVGAEIDLTPYADGESYLATRSRDLGKDHRRQLRRLMARGGFALLREEGADRHAALDWLLASKLDWLRRQNLKSGWIANGQAARLLHELLEHPDIGSSIWLDSLKVGGARVAVSLGFTEADVARVSIVSHDPSIAKLSPGRTLVITQIMRAIADGFRVFDLGLGTLDWKDRLTEGRYTVTSGRLRLR